MAMDEEAAAKLDAWDQAKLLIFRPAGGALTSVAAHAYLIPGDRVRLVWVVPYEPGDPHDSPLGHQFEGRVMKVVDDAIVFLADVSDYQIMVSRADAASSPELRAWLGRRTPAEVRADRARELASLHFDAT